LGKRNKCWKAKALLIFNDAVQSSWYSAGRSFPALVQQH
jgi:hypothetical protein